MHNSTFFAAMLSKLLCRATAQRAAPNYSTFLAAMLKNFCVSPSATTLSLRHSREREVAGHIMLGGYFADLRLFFGADVGGLGAAGAEAAARRRVDRRGQVAFQGIV